MTTENNENRRDSDTKTSTTTDHSRLVVIKRYTNPTDAYMDAELLRSNGIECSVDGAIGGTVLSFIQGQVTLIVSGEDAAKAVDIVPEASLCCDND